MNDSPIPFEQEFPEAGAALVDILQHNASCKPADRIMVDMETGQTFTATQRCQPTAGRNDPCPCGSGKKFKKCCGG